MKPNLHSSAGIMNSGKHEFTPAGWTFSARERYLPRYGGQPVKWGTGKTNMAGVASILVTGAGGRIGSVLRHHWAGRPLAPLWIGRTMHGPGGLAADILAEIPQTPAADVVLALAGVVPGGGADMALNTDLALAGCELAKEAGARRVLVASSAAVYGPGTGADLREDAPLAPVAAYGRAKLAMEHAVTRWHEAAPGRPAVTILRIGNIAGLDALLGGNLPGATVALDPVPGQAGGPVRSYIGVKGLADVLLALCEVAATGADMPPVLNVAAEPPVTMAALLAADGRPWRYGPDNPAVLGRVVLDTGALRSLLPGLALTTDAAEMVRQWHAWKDATA
ncbi:SDR family oxidoreductase [Aliigemmobacter aestuarii]|uniref:UDP-glucose 4-epimerase n=1 Tax=Aliigemmobacter aestuarii TaxID=1445661 RepID=A0A4V3V0V5_9RHOB|nr:SDR family oxidoreductase [Gemmobacter aestuarii]